MSKKIKNLIVDTTAFINNAPLQEIAENVITIQEVIDEVTNKRQLRRLVVLPYDLQIKTVFPENVKIVTDFSKKTGDYPSLSATDIKVIALTYQLEKELVGIEHLKTAPTQAKTIVNCSNNKQIINTNVAGFYLPNEQEINEKLDNLDLEENVDDILAPVRKDSFSEEEEESSDDESGWITPSNLKIAQEKIDSELVLNSSVEVACITTDFAMQNVLKQLGLHVSALDGREINQIRTFILRCHTCFLLTSKMEKLFCPKCGNNTLKKVAVSVDEAGNQTIHINARKQLTARGKKFSLPTFKGGKHSKNPILVEDQPMPQQRPSRQAKMKNNPLDPDYTAGFSPFVMRDINSRSALLGIRPDGDMKHWMQKNPNQARRRRKK